MFSEAFYSKLFMEPHVCPTLLKIQKLHREETKIERYKGNLSSRVLMTCIVIVSSIILMENKSLVVRKREIYCSISAHILSISSQEMRDYEQSLHHLLYVLVLLTTHKGYLVFCFIPSPPGG